MVPLLIWWGLEDKAFVGKSAILAWFARAGAWNAALSRAEALRLIRRYAAEGSVEGYNAANRLLDSAPAAYGKEALTALNQGLGEREGAGRAADTALYADVGRTERTQPGASRRSYAPVSGGLRTYIAARWQESKSDPLRAQLALRANIPGVQEHALSVARSSSAPEAERKALLEVLEELGGTQIVADLLPLLEGNQPLAVRLATIRTLNRFDDAAIAARPLVLYETMPPPLKSAARDLLFSRTPSALAFLDRIGAHPDWAKEVPITQVRLIASLSAKDLDARVRKIWGNVGEGTPEEKLATMRRFSNDLRAAAGDLKSGMRVYNQACARCHKLFGSGGEMGMDLTNANRADRTYLLTHIVDPSVFIRKEYMSYDVHTRSGRVLFGLMAEQDAASVTLIDADYRKTRVQRFDISGIEESNVSIMPEGLLEKLTPQQLRDLFAYLQSPTKP